ncbi:MAG: DNA polymerase III subunit gamma/tau [Deltaproteobacteria bacterium]|nr:DNA polymerase III subunit gamma/tau [Deltaproteobacteria bacterium]
MSYLVLARKYRPQTFEEVVRQEHVTKTLINSIKANRVAHAILFTGTRGAGKTTIARILAKAMNCRKGPSPIPCNECDSCKEIINGYSPDVIEIDGASNNSVDDVRELIENAKYMPSHSKFKIYIIDEIHMLSKSAFNALLKTLEEPPAHILFFFATTEPRKIPITILSRCQRHDLRRIDTPSIVKHLAFISKEEEVEISEATLNMIARQGAGSIRDSLSLLDHVISGSSGKILHETALNILVAVDRKIVFSFSQALIDSDIKKALSILNEVYLRGSDIKIFYKEILTHFRDIILISMGKPDIVDAPDSEIEIMTKSVEKKPFGMLNRIFEFLLKEEAAINFSNNSKLLIETILIRLAYVKPVMSVDKLISKLDLIYDKTQALKQEAFEYKKAKTAEPEGSLLKETPAEYNEKFDYEKRKKIKPKIEAPKPIEVPEPEEKSGGAIDVSDKEALWDAALKLIEAKSPAMASHLEGSFPSRLSENKITIEATGNKVVIDRLNLKKSLDVISKAVSEVAGKTLKAVIDGKIVNGKKNGVKKSNKKELENKALNHPLVQEAMEVFDGRIKSLKVL